MRRTLSLRCAKEMCGQDTAAPPSIVMNSRRFTSNMAPPPVPPVAAKLGMTISQGRTARWPLHDQLAAEPLGIVHVCSKANTLRRDSHGV
jgi:hypothetical protein